MMKVSRSIMYKEKEPINFFLGEGDTFERDFLDELRKRPFMRNLVDKSTNILRIFNNACYICTLIYEGDYPLLEITEYERIAIDDHDDPIWINYLFPATMSLVVKWLSSVEGKNIFEEKVGKKDMEKLCSEICARIEELCAHNKDGKDDYHALDLQERYLPSGFIKEGCFQRRAFAEVIEDSTIKGNDIFESLGFLADVMKNNIDEFTGALASDFMKKQAPNVTFNDAGIKAKLAEWLGSNINDSKAETLNCQIGQPRFTSTQVGILLTAVGKLTEKDPPGKTTLGDIVQRITGYRSKTNSQNMRGTISEADKRIVADVLRKQFPKLADEVMKVY